MTFYIMLIEADDEKVTEWSGRAFVKATDEMIRTCAPFGVAELYQVKDEKAFEAFQKEARLWRR